MDKALEDMNCMSPSEDAVVSPSRKLKTANSPANSPGGVRIRLATTITTTKKDAAAAAAAAAAADEETSASVSPSKLFVVAPEDDAYASPGFNRRDQPPQGGVYGDFSLESPQFASPMSVSPTLSEYNKSP